MRNDTILISVTDDHTLFRKGLISLIQSLGPEYQVCHESSNGEELMPQLENGIVPQIAIVDVNMPRKDGFETVRFLQEKYPDIKILIVSMIDAEETVVQMLKLGVKGYLSKDVEPADLKKAITALLERGYYYTDFITGRLVHELKKGEQSDKSEIQLTAKELNFLQLVCSELTYKEIAYQMHLSLKTIDGFRDAMFKKFEVTSRVGLVLYAIKNGHVKL